MDIIVRQKEYLYQMIAKEISTIVRHNPKAVLGLATGSSSVGIYKALVEDYRINRTSYQDIITFNLDEYEGISEDHHQSYSHFMKTHFFNHIDIRIENTHLPNLIHSDERGSASSYNQLFNQYQLDIQLLGIGRNGHIGFNEPGTRFDSSTHRIKLDEKTRHDNARLFKSIDEVPQYAITLGIQNIMSAKKIILIATGLNKAEAVRDMIQGPISEDCPASVLQRHNNVTVYLDHDASSLLK